MAHLPMEGTKMTDTSSQTTDGRAYPVQPDEYGDEGMSTAEYAIGTVAAAAFAALLYAIVTGDSVVTALTNLIARALSVNF